MNHRYWLTACLFGLMLPACPELRADELYTRGGDRLVGQVITETAEYVEFRSTEIGAVRVPRASIVRLERSGALAEQVETATAPVALAASGTTTPETASVDVSTPVAEKSGEDPPRDVAVEKGAVEMDKRIRRYYPLRGWKTSFRFGLNLRRGQDSDTALDIGYRSEKIDARKREYHLEFRFYRKDNVETNGQHATKDNSLSAEFRFRKYFRPRWFIQFNTRYYRDPTINLLHEATQSGGVGYWLLRSDRLKLSAGPAAGIQYTEYTNQLGWHFVIGAYQDFQYDLLKSFRIREEAYYFQDPWNKINHAVRTHLELSQKLSRIISIGFAWDYAFEGEVGGNISQNQQRLGLNLGLDF
jgi:hypothetical protein